VIDYVARWQEKTELPIGTFVRWLGVGSSKFYTWRDRYGKVNEHNGRIPRDFWLEAQEKEAIVAFHDRHPLEGYRRLTFMMLDADVAAVSPSSVYRVLRAAGRLDRNRFSPSKKGTGFVQPLAAHQHWHVDLAYVNVAGTFYFLCTLLDGYSRAVVHWELRPNMEEADVEIVVQRAREKYPDEKPRIISDNGPQFLARDFKEFIRQAGLTHVRTSPYYPQSNGKLERYHRTVKGTCLRPGSFADAAEVRRALEKFVEHYNQVRLHSALGYITPADKLAGREQEIFQARDAKLEAAREKRRVTRQTLAAVNNAESDVAAAAIGA
jgi:transposase InsO family protein